MINEAINSNSFQTFDMPSQILLNPIGSAGDVFPFLAIGRELQKRGHHVAVMTNPIFRRNVGQAGMEFVEIGSRAALRAVGADPRLHKPGNAWKLALKWGAVGTLRQTFDVIRKRIAKCDTMLVAPSTGLGARMAAEKFKIPLATIALSPFVIRSIYQSPVINPLVLADWVPKISKRLQFWIADRFVIDPLLRTEVDSFRKENGLPRQSRFLHRWCFSDDITLALFPETFAPRQPDWPANTHLVGNVSWDPPLDSAVAKKLDEFIDPNRKPIAVLAGSAGPETPAFYENWIQATKRLNRKLILLEKNPNLVPKQLPKHVLHSEYIPIDCFINRAELIAHGGGIGSTLRSLTAGVPQILFPKVNDQPDNANRIRKLGAGRIIRQKQMHVEKIVATLDEVIGNHTIERSCSRLKELATQFNSVSQSCDLIESTFSKYRK